MERGLQDPRQERKPQARPVSANGNGKVMKTLDLT